MAAHGPESGLPSTFWWPAIGRRKQFSLRKCIIFHLLNVPVYYWKCLWESESGSTSEHLLPEYEHIHMYKHTHRMAMDIVQSRSYHLLPEYEHIHMYKHTHRMAMDIVRSRSYHLLPEYEHIHMYEHTHRMAMNIVRSRSYHLWIIILNIKCHQIQATQLQLPWLQMFILQNTLYYAHCADILHILHYKSIMKIKK